MGNAKVHYPLLVLVFMLVSGCKMLDDEPANESPVTGWLGDSGGSAPAIWGEPETDVLVNSQYIFVPEASDADGDVLKFSVVNKPAWAEFDEVSGRLQGIPGGDDVGSADDIVISVADNKSVVSLPGFSITVNSMPVQDDGSGSDDGSDDGSAASAPPSISGKPNASAVAGHVYTFHPEASDPEGDTLSFSVVNKPSWASFEPASGRLSGTPTSGDVGRSDPINLSVTDGSNIAALTPFIITVHAAGPSSYTVSWIPPTENVDGTPLTDLAGYRIYYGTAPGAYTETIEIDSPGITSYAIGNLAPGTYFLVMTSVNSRDMESKYSSEKEFEPTS